MLQGIQGGLTKGRRAASAAAEFSAFFNEQLTKGGEDSAFGAALALEIISSFLAQVVAPLAGARAADEEQTAETDAAALRRLPAREIVRASGACLRLFPFQAVVSHAVIEMLPREVERLVTFVSARGHANDDDVEAFARHRDAARDAFSRHSALQLALDRSAKTLHSIAIGERVVGRFQIDAVHPAALDVSVPPEGNTYRVVVPPRLPVRFEPGQAVSMLIQRMTLGWMPLSAALPERAADLDDLFDRCWKPLWKACP